MGIVFQGTVGDDLAYGSNTDDQFFDGGGGGDIFYGFGGNDYFDIRNLNVNARIFGGAGNDIYVLNSVVEMFEEANGGIDTIIATTQVILDSPQSSHAGLDYFENIILASQPFGNARGNRLANTIWGDIGQDRLEGVGGNDILYGNVGIDDLEGGDGADLLYGGLGADALDGGAGTDTASYAQATAAVSASLATGGTAGEAAGDTFALVENLTGSNFGDRLTGDAARNTLNGGAGNDVLSGGGSVDLLAGGAGNDVLNGGIGKDRLAGGAGRDFFAFSTPIGPAHVDAILDYNVAQDTIRLDNAVFTAITGTGTLTNAQFWKSASGLAHDRNDRVIYETDTGKLFYDSNGNAAGGRVQIAVLTGHPSLTHFDIQIV